MLRISKRCVALLCTCLMAVALCGCAADDNKNNDVSNALAEALLEAAQQQNQQAQQNTEETDLQPQDAVSAQEAPVLMTDLSFPGIATSDTWHNDDGSYVESFQYDGAAMLIQFCRFPGDCDKAGAINAVAEFTGVSKESIEAEKTPFGPYEAYRLFYTWGSFEDASFCRDMMIIAEGQMYLFHTRTAADYFDQHSDEIDEWMDGLILDSHPRTLAQSLLEATQQESTPTPTESNAKPGKTAVGSGNMTDDINWAEALEEWWVVIGEDADDPELYLFSENGHVYRSVEEWDDAQFYGESSEYTDCSWAEKDGCAVYIEGKKTPIEYALSMPDDEHMILADADGKTRALVKASSADAVFFLAMGEYYYLVSKFLPLVNIRECDLPEDENGYPIYVNYVEWIDVDDTELIEKYGLQDAYFDDDYELYEDERQFSFYIDEKTDPQIVLIDWRSDNPALNKMEVSAAEFRQLLEEKNGEPLLATILCKSGPVVMIREVYVP